VGHEVGEGGGDGEEEEVAEVADARVREVGQAAGAVIGGAYVSYYLAALSGVAPAPTQAVDQLKRHLSPG